MEVSVSRCQAAVARYLELLPPGTGIECGKPTHFTVYTKGAGKAPLDVQFAGAARGKPVRDFEIIDNYDYSHTVKYTPVQQVGQDVTVESRLWLCLVLISVLGSSDILFSTRKCGVMRFLCM